MNQDHERASRGSFPESEASTVDPGSGAGNLDARTVEGFGREWGHFDQSRLPAAELQALFHRYFTIFPFDSLPPKAEGFDLGCGSGRWAKLVAPLVGRLHCVDASAQAIAVARRNLADLANCTFHEASVDAIPLADGSQDFGYSLGVLHHVPDTLAGIRACTDKLKPGAPFLLYLYYAFDNRPAWFRAVWRASDLVRRFVSRSPWPVKWTISQAIALLVYYPLARLSRLLERMGRNVEHVPLSSYRHLSLYTMRTDALDRFGTRLERRFRKEQIQAMMETAGLERIRFHHDVPFWCAVGYRSRPSSRS